MDPDKRRQRRGGRASGSSPNPRQDQTSLTPHIGKGYLAVPKDMWLRDESADTQDFYMYKAKSMAEMLDDADSEEVFLSHEDAESLLRTNSLDPTHFFEWYDIGLEDSVPKSDIDNWVGRQGQGDNTHE